MLPCKTDCKHYYEGCHKTCVHWKELLKIKQTERQQKKMYLTYHSQRCNDIIRQCYRTLPYTLYR